MHGKSLLIITQAVDAADSNLGFFIRWIEEFSRHTDRVTVICLRKGEAVLPANVRVLSLGKEEGVSRLRYLLRLYRYVWSYRHEYDAVFVHMNPEYVVLCGFLWKILRKRVALWYAHKSVTRLLRVALSFVDVVFTASPESFRLAHPTVRVMGHGIDTRRTLPPRVPSHGVLRCFSSGRISASKGIDVMVDAYRLLKERGNSVSLILCGSPITEADVRYAEVLKQNLRARGESPETILVGSVPHAELPQYRARADYFLHASRTGSLDKAVLDAIMSGLVPISSSEAYHELFRSYESRLVYSPQDAAGLADRVVALAALPEEERGALVQELQRRVVEQHSLENLIPAMLTQLMP